MSTQPTSSPTVSEDSAPPNPHAAPAPTAPTPPVQPSSSPTSDASQSRRGDPPPTLSLSLLKSLSLERLHKTLSNPDTPDRECRLAAGIVLRYAAATEPRPTRASAAPAPTATPTARERSASDSSPTSDIPHLAESPRRPPSAIPPEWHNTHPDSTLLADRHTNLGPIPDHIARNHHVQSIQRAAYDSGYWTGWNNSPSHKAPPYPRAVTAPGSSANPLALLNLRPPTPAQLTIRAAGAPHAKEPLPSGRGGSPVHPSPNPRAPPSPP